MTAPGIHMPAAELDALVTAHLGHYDGDVSWRLRHGIDSPEQLGHVIADRDSMAVRHMTGQSGHVCDRAQWWPVLVAKCAALVAAVDRLAEEVDR